MHNVVDTISLPSFRNGEKFTVGELRFGAMKRVYAGGTDDEFALLDKMVTETMKMAFPDVTTEEIDDITMTNMKTLSDEIARANGAEMPDFTAKKTTK